jgi:hypothetical protein
VSKQLGISRVVLSSMELVKLCMDEAFKCVQVFGGKARGKETTRKTMPSVGG